jgi:hypothetical protein
MKAAARAIIFAACCAIPTAHAERFVNSYITFSLPQGWACQLEGDSFVCKPPAPQGKPVSAIMILAAKLAGPQDTLTAYLQHLEQHPAAAEKRKVIAQPKIVTIDRTLWVDGTLFEAEVPNYLTRYLATSNQGLAVLFTFSAHRAEYDAHVGAALEAIHTLQTKDDWKKPSPTR